MNPHLNFNFSVNKENNTVHVKREFNANLELVWEAWTTPELLDQWWAPKPYITHTKSMDFTEGGHWLYAMVAPDGTTHWCRADYKKIIAHQLFTWVDAFCDENGLAPEPFPNAHWNTQFVKTGATTTVDIVIEYASLEQLEQIVAMGFKEGFTMAMENLDQYIEQQFKLRNKLRTDSNARVCTYLNFPGTTEEAFLFYKKVFKSEFNGGGIQRFGDLPADANHPPVADAIQKMVLHVELPILNGHVLMATDAPTEMGFTLNRGNNMHICLEPESREETDRIFKELSEGGTVTMPLADMFFGAYFAEFSDRYGINWMLNFKTQ